MKRLETIQALRAFAAWSVVAHHMNQFFRGNIDFGVVGQYFEQYGAMGVDLFFVISGFVIYLTELIHRQVKYDCRYVTYPLAIDIPQEIIKQCQGKIL